MPFGPYLAGAGISFADLSQSNLENAIMDAVQMEETKFDGAKGFEPY